MKKIFIIIFLLIYAAFFFFWGEKSHDVWYNQLPIYVSPNDSAMLRLAKLYLDNQPIENWWCTSIRHRGDSTYFEFLKNNEYERVESSFFGFVTDFVSTPAFPKIIKFYKGNIVE